MSELVQVKIEDRASDLIRRIADRAAARAPALFADLGKALERDLRDHFRALEGRGNEKGWPSKHFFIREGADRTALTSYSAGGAVVGIASAAMAHRLRGGTVRPKRGRRLAIPLNEEAYKKGSPREWDDRTALFHPGGTRILARKLDGGRLEAMYALVASVTHRPRPETLPDMKEEGVKLARRARAWLRRISRNS